MQIFAEEVMPVIASECGGKVELPARGLDLVILADQIVPRVKPEDSLSCKRCMIRMMAPFSLSLRRL